MEPKVNEATKNIRGDLGPICNYCGGYGFTNALSQEGGTSHGCSRCFGSGVQPIDTRELYNQVQDIKKALAELLRRK